MTKEGSIEGSKKDAINIVYTPWRNLKKEASMEVGAVGYHNLSLKKLVKNVETNK